MFSKYKSKLFLIILLSGHLTAENLLDIYNEALENDPTFNVVFKRIESIVDKYNIKISIFVCVMCIFLNYR